MCAAQCGRVVRLSTAPIQCRANVSLRLNQTPLLHHTARQRGVPQFAQGNPDHQTGPQIDEERVISPSFPTTKIDLFSVLQLCVALPCLQISFGFGLSPWLVQQLQDYPKVASGVGPLIAQLALAVTSGALIQRALARNSIKAFDFFKYTAQPGDLTLGSASVILAIVGSILLSKLSGVSEVQQVPRSVEEVQSIVSLQQPIAVIGVGIASILAAPWIEERIYRGAILQGLLPHIGPTASVAVSSGLFAASHVTTDGFLQLCFLGTILSVGHLRCRRNLLVPTFVHAVFNCTLFLNILIK